MYVCECACFMCMFCAHVGACACVWVFVCERCLHACAHA